MILVIGHGISQLGRAWRAAAGAQRSSVVTWDLGRGHQSSLGQQTNGQLLRGLLRGRRVRSIWMSVPHATWEACRTTVPLRRGDASQLPGLRPFHQLAVAEADRTAKLAASLVTLAADLGVPCVIESPSTSLLWRFPCMQAISRSRHVASCLGDMCVWGGRWRRRTRFLGCHVDPTHWSALCSGPSCCRSGRKHASSTGDQVGYRHAHPAGKYRPPLCRAIVEAFNSSTLSTFSRNVFRFMM